MARCASAVLAKVTKPPKHFCPPLLPFLLALTDDARLQHPARAGAKVVSERLVRCVFRQPADEKFVVA